MVLGMNWFWNGSMNWAFNWEHAFVDSHQMGKDLKGSYLMFMNDPSREMYKTYEIDLDRHSYDGTN